MNEENRPYPLRDLGPKTHQSQGKLLHVNDLHAEHIHIDRLVHETACVTHEDAGGCNGQNQEDREPVIWKGNVAEVRHKEPPEEDEAQGRRKQKPANQYARHPEP